jgi:iron complex transport system substrate-binding protein
VKKLAVLIMMMLIFAGCDNKDYTEYGGEITGISGEELVAMSESQLRAEEQKREEEAEIERLIAESEALASVSVADRIGGIVSLPEIAGESLRIVSCNPAATEILAGLGLLDNIVAADTNSADIPGIDAAICTLDMMNLNTQYIADVSPDMVVIGEISRNGSSDPLTELEDMGIYTAYIPSANSIEGIKMDIEFLAVLTGKTDAGNALISDINTELLYIDELIADSPRPAVLFTISETPEIYAVGANNFIADMLERAGGQTVLTDYSGFVPLTADEIAAYPNAPIKITNVKDGNAEYIYVDTNLTSRPSQHITEGIRELAMIIHPELFEVVEEIAA